VRFDQIIRNVRAQGLLLLADVTGRLLPPEFDHIDTAPATRGVRPPQDDDDDEEVVAATSNNNQP
jgi:hypothetical protein